MTRILRMMMLAGAAMTPGLAQAAEQPLSIRSSFRLGDAGVLCTAQVRPTDKRLSGMFDRSYLLTCRDAAAPIGSVLAVRRAVDAAAEPSALPMGAINCKPQEGVSIDKLGPVRALSCRDEAAGLDYRRYSVQRGNTFYLVEGLAASARASSRSAPAKLPRLDCCSPWLASASASDVGSLPSRATRLSKNSALSA